MKTLTKLLSVFALTVLSITGWAGEGKYTSIHTDHLGSPIMATDEAGEVIWRKNYQPFGEEEEKNDFQESMGYAGHMVEQDSGLVYMQGRWYHPGMGRFLAPDPVKYTDENPVMSFNRYAYANNNPYKYNDPDGEFINFAVKFVADVAMGAAINYMTTGSMDLGAAIQDSAMGVLNPAKSLQKMQKLSKLMRKGNKGDKGGNSGRGCCFVAGTQVLTEDGYKNIEEVQLGEKLWAKNTDTGEEAWKPVTKLWREPDRGIYEIRLVTVDGYEQKIEATDDHPFYVVDKGWKTTIALEAGDKVESNLGEPLTVEFVTDEKRTSLTYNFTVADFHTYYVTKQNVLVHNCGDCEGGVCGATKSGADNIATLPKLKKQLIDQSARSPFSKSGTLTDDAINNSSKIIDSAQIRNKSIPEGFSKYTTETFQSPSGNFQMHFYKNDKTGEVFYGQDYKAVFNKMSGNH